MRRTPVRLAGLVAAALLAACETTIEKPAPAGDTAPAGDGGTATASDVSANPATETTSAAGTPPVDGPSAPPVPHIYLALQPGGTGRPVSAVFAIDAARDGNPSDDPAIRLTPEAGRCNPQEMRRYDFPPEATTPVVSEPEQARGLTPQDLPRFLAAAVTGRLIDAGLAAEPEDTRPLNVCTRKLWERLVVARNGDRPAEGQ